MLGNENSATSEDQERYLEMAMRLDSNDSEILERNKNIWYTYIWYRIYIIYQIIQTQNLSIKAFNHLVRFVFFKSYGTFLCRKQYGLDETFIPVDYRYIEYFRKSLENGPFREELFYKIKYHESKRDYLTPSLRPINHLIQIDEKPNLDLIEPKRELYKISVSFFRIRKLYKIYWW